MEQMNIQKPPDVGMEFALSADRVTAPPVFELLTAERLDEVKQIGKKVFPASDIEYFNRSFDNAVLPKDQIDNIYNDLGVLEAHVMVVDGRIAGVIGLKTYKDEPDEVWISWIFRNPDYHGGQVGKGLMDFVQQCCRDSECGVLRLLTSDDPDYEAAHKLYDEYGFIREEVVYLPPCNDGTNFVVYSLALDGRKMPPFECKKKHLADEQPFKDYLPQETLMQFGLTQSSDAPVKPNKHCNHPNRGTEPKAA